jgi:hypothetical protein
LYAEITGSPAVVEIAGPAVSSVLSLTRFTTCFEITIHLSILHIDECPDEGLKTVIRLLASIQSTM